MRDEMWWWELEAAVVVGDATLDEYLCIDDDPPRTHGVELPSADDAPTLDAPNGGDDDDDDPVPLGGELSCVQAADVVVQLCNFIATHDNADCHIAALSSARSTASTRRGRR